ncbi:MAG TPA: FecR domain-containing protein [Candidatus Acidoferrales bacterium]|nr:FecR domain-containing protein [Candidatus Acidoferrales bacterium]
MHSIRSTIGLLISVAAISVPAWGATANQAADQMQSASDNQTAAPAQPGTLNYVEGQASLGEQPINSKSVGSAALSAGQVVTTEVGKAELLLTPGVFLRVGDHSAVKMISASLSETAIEVEKGEATVEVAEIHRENDLRVNQGGASIRLLKTGFYDFDKDQGVVRVFKGEASVHHSNGKRFTIKGNHQLALNTHPLKSRGFDSKQYDTGDLYRWSSLRSAYEAEANVNAASTYAGGDWFNPGWSWDPWFDCYAFIPGDGIMYSPFGWGFYSPWLVGESPFYYYGGYYGGNYYRHFDRDFHSWGPGPHYGPHPIWGGGHTYRGFGGGLQGGARGGGIFHGGGGLGGGGGFHGGGGGGFHGGGFGGGRGR